MGGFSNFTIFLLIFALAFISSIITAVDVANPSQDIGKIFGIIPWLLCLLLILRQWKKFTIILRIASILLFLIATFFTVCSVLYLFSIL